MSANGSAFPEQASEATEFKGKGKAVEQQPDAMMEEDDDEDEDEESGAEEQNDDDEEEEEGDPEIDTNNIIGRRTRGTHIDFRAAEEKLKAEGVPEEDEDEDDDDEFEDPEDDKDAMKD